MSFAVDVIRRGRAVICAVLLLCGGGLLFLAGSSATPANRSTPSARMARATPCGTVAQGHEATDALHVAGGHMVDSPGHRFEPYGISLVGGPDGKHWGRTERSTAAQIVAAAGAWHANVQRLQISEDLLFANPTRGFSYNVAFAQNVDRLVCLILRVHDIPVINDNTLFTGNTRAPTSQTLRFWRFMSRRYGNVLPVIFDLFNEPRLRRVPSSGAIMSPGTVWRLWERGGVLDGVRYVGMQALVDEIRRTERVNNIIWVEGAYKAADLGAVSDHLLKGTNLVYTFHKGTPGDGPSWRRDIRRLVSRGIPLVNGEWSQFASTTRPWECFSGAYSAVPRYLEFLRQMSVGLVAWSLQPGSLVKGIAGRNTVHDSFYSRFTTDPRQLVTPSVLTRTYRCDRASRGQGAGALVMSYFKKLSVKAPDQVFPTFG